MKSLIAAVLGLAAGAWISACSCPPDPGYHQLSAGSYKLSRDTSGEADYKLVVSGDKKTVTESFTRAGVSYQVSYTVTGSSEQHN